MNMFNFDNISPSSFFNSIPFAITDRDGFILNSNLMFLEFYRKINENIELGPFLLPKITSKLILSRLSGDILNGLPRTVRYRHQQTAGGTRWIEVFYAPQRLSGNIVEYVVCRISDVTQLSESSEIFDGDYKSKSLPYTGNEKCDLEI